MPSTKLFRMDLNKSVPPWRRKSWRKRYSHTKRMRNQVKLAAGAHLELIWRKAYEQVPALIRGSYARRSFARSCHLGGGVLLPMSNPRPPNMSGRNLNLPTEIVSSVKISPHPIHHFGLCHQMRQFPLPNPLFPYESYIHEE